MRINLKVQGVEMAKARLAEVGRKIDPVIRGTLNTTATNARADRYVRPMMGSFGKRAWLNQAIKVKRAGAKRKDARLIPSSSGVPVTRMKRWGFDPISPTRARIWVAGPGGRKVAAGFVNPASDGKKPLSTRSEKARNLKRPDKARNPQITSYRYEHALREAMAPSVAYWFKLMTDGKAIMWINAFMQQEFERRIRREIAKGVRR
jgi:hypothetical protein